MILIFGCGLTGISVAKFLTLKNQSFIIYDTRKNPPRQHQLPASTKKYFGFLPQTILSNIKKIILSPAIEPKNHIIELARQQSIEIISDIDLFYAYNSHKIFIGITGTNGKSTTTKLIAHILTANNKKAVACGNIGLPILDAPNYDIYVIELSSYQLDITHNIILSYATILNIAPDHLARYHSFKQYINSKLKICRLTNHNIINPHNPYTKNIVGSDFIKMNIPSSNNYHRDTVLAAATITNKLGISKKAIKQAITTFTPLPHRLEFVTTINKTDFYNDSKATNANATIYAINTLAAKYNNITLILGGAPKPENYDLLFEIINNKIAQIILIGASKINFSKSIIINKWLKDNMQQAVKLALTITTNVVVLSPACASFDSYDNFMERGDDFKKWLRIQS